jgi:hypothetical protein
MSIHLIHFLLNGIHILLATNLTEKVHDTRENNEQNTTTGTETEHLGDETLVEGAEAFFLHDGANGRPGPVVLGHLAGDLGGVLDARLDDVHGGVEDGTRDTTDGTRDQVVAGLLGLVAGFGSGELRADLEDAAEVAAVPEDVTPQRRLEAVVHGKRTLRGDDLAHHVQHTVVLACGSAILQTDLDQLKGHDHKGLGGARGGTCQHGQRLCLLLRAEQSPVEGAPAVVGGELGRTLGSLHQDGGRDTAV